VSLTELFDRHPELEFHSITVLRAGRTLLQRTWSPYRDDDAVLVYSVSKTFTATAIGFAIAEGRIGLTDRIVDLLPHAVPDPVHPRVAEITVHHLLSMSTGHDVDTAEAVVDEPAEAWARGVLDQVPRAPVGSRHVYNNGASFLLGEVIRQHTGEDLIGYLGPRLFEPLGISPSWERDPLGRCLGWSGLHVAADALAAMGELYRCDGRWQGRQVLPDGWVKLATAAHIDTPESEQAEWRYGYGYQLWRNREGFRLDGAYGQYAIVLPERELVVAITSAQARNQRMLDFIFDELIPALPPEPVELADGALATPTDTGAGERWTAPSAALDASLVDDEEIEQLFPPTISDMDIQRTADGWLVKLTSDGELLTVAAGAGRWQRQQVILGGNALPVAAAAGAGVDGALSLLLTFPETPHTLQLRLAGDDTATMAWRTAPLNPGGLGALRAP
jgi:CubicO group peptidase (beta-lactamase class C family)